MRTCPQCERVMMRETSSGSVIFTCYCGIQINGEPEDARIAGNVLNSGETIEMYRRLIYNASYDRTTNQVKRDCPECNIDYMTQIRVGPREVVLWSCKCGYISGINNDQ